MGFTYLDLSTTILYLGTPMGLIIGLLIGMSINFNDPGDSQ